MRSDGAVIVCAKVDGFAAKRAAVVDEFLGLFDGHVGWCLGATKRKSSADVALVGRFVRADGDRCSDVES